MPDAPYSVSPYCVGYPLSDGSGIPVAHALHGSRFELSADLLALVDRIARGAAPEEVLSGESAEAQEAVRTLIAEEILVERTGPAAPDGDDAFRNRLGPIALAL